MAEVKCPAGCDRGTLLKPCGKPCAKALTFGGGHADGSKLHDCGKH